MHMHAKWMHNLQSCQHCKTGRRVIPSLLFLLPFLRYSSSFTPLPLSPSSSFPSLPLPFRPFTSFPFFPLPFPSLPLPLNPARISGGALAVKCILCVCHYLKQRWPHKFAIASKLKAPVQGYNVDVENKYLKIPFYSSTKTVYCCQQCLYCSIKLLSS